MILIRHNMLPSWSRKTYVCDSQFILILSNNVTFSCFMILMMCSGNDFHLIKFIRRDENGSFVCKQQICL